MSDNLLPKEALTTAWFLEIINDWFDACNARSRYEEIYTKSGEKIKTLLFMLDFIPTLSFVSSNFSSWKPVQTGILIFTQSLLD